MWGVVFGVVLLFGFCGVFCGVRRGLVVLSIRRVRGLFKENERKVFLRGYDGRWSREKGIFVMAELQVETLIQQLQPYLES